MYAFSVSIQIYKDQYKIGSLYRTPWPHDMLSICAWSCGHLSAVRGVSSSPLVWSASEPTKKDGRWVDEVSPWTTINNSKRTQHPLKMMNWKHLGASTLEKVCKQTHMTQCKALCGDWLFRPKLLQIKVSLSDSLRGLSRQFACPELPRIQEFVRAFIDLGQNCTSKSHVSMYHAHWLQSLQFLNQGYIWTTCGKITLHSRWGLGPWESLDESLPMWCLSSEWSDAVLFVQFCGIQVALCILYVHVEKWISWYLHVCI